MISPPTTLSRHVGGQNGAGCINRRGASKTRRKTGRRGLRAKEIFSHLWIWPAQWLPNGQGRPRVGGAGKSAHRVLRARQRAKGGLRLAAHAFELECGAGRGVRSGIGLSARAFRSVARGWKCTFHSRALRGGERRTRRDAPEKHGKTEPKVVCWGSSVIRKVRRRGRRGRGARRAPRRRRSVRSAEADGMPAGHARRLHAAAQPQLFSRRAHGGGGA